MTIKIQKLTLWFYILLFASLNGLSNLNNVIADGLNSVLIQIVVFSLFSCLTLFVLKKRQRAIEGLDNKINFRALYQHEWITIILICISNIIDIFFLTDISYYTYLIAVFYHLYWFFKNYSIYTKNKK